MSQVRSYNHLLLIAGLNPITGRDNDLKLGCKKVLAQKTVS